MSIESAGADVQQQPDMVEGANPKLEALREEIGREETLLEEGRGKLRALINDFDAEAAHDPVEIQKRTQRVLARLEETIEKLNERFLRNLPTWAAGGFGAAAIVGAGFTEAGSLARLEVGAGGALAAAAIATIKWGIERISLELERREKASQKIEEQH